MVMRSSQQLAVSSQTRQDKELYVIIQNDPSNLNYQQDWLKNTVSKWGVKFGEFKYGALRVLELKV